MKSLFALALIGMSSFAFSYDSYLVKFKNASEQENFFSKKELGMRAQDLKISETSLALIYKDDKSTDELFVKRLKKIPGVVLVEPNYKLHALGVTMPTDPKYSSQWGLNGKESVNAPMAWEITKGGRQVKIAVIDTGIDYNHPDLKDQMWVNEAEKNGVAGVDDDGNGYIDDVYGYDFVNSDSDPMDDNKHGTHCAGIIGASHNSIGVAGVMKDVQLIALKFLSRTGSGDNAGAILAIDYAIKMGANILSNSWGGGADEYSTLMIEAITRARDHGILFMAAAGNDGANNETAENYPANYKVDNIISVASHDRYGKKSSFSNYGKNVHVAAPGSSILSTVPKAQYATLSGTSMATPFVSGVAGLLMAQYPQMSYLEIKERLIQTSVKNTSLQNASISGGRIDAYRALENIQN